MEQAYADRIEGPALQRDPGRPPKLSSEQKVQLEQVLLAGPLAAGIARTFGR